MKKTFSYIVSPFKIKFQNIKNINIEVQNIHNINKVKIKTTPNTQPTL
jgi:hypothetical protein